MRKKTLFGLAIVLMFFASCNWNTITGDFVDNDSSNGINDSVVLFQGDAPKNVYASQSYYSDRIILSFDAVSGADYYKIYRSEDGENWTAIPELVHSDLNSGQLSFTDYDVSDNVIYHYKVVAGSYYSDFKGNVTAKESEIADGWLLSPPNSLTASQGTDENYINIEWNQADLVRGYNIEYFIPSGTIENWQTLNSSVIPAPYGVETIRYKYQPAKENKGIDIYFRVVSISRGGARSNYSSIINGYTYAEGAPLAPNNLEASAGLYPNYIEVKWEKPEMEINTGTTIPGSYYIWEIFRTAPNGSPVSAISFSTFDESTDAPQSVSLVDGYYVFHDAAEEGVVDVGVEYTYTVRATLVKPASGDMDRSELIGISAKTAGYLTQPPASDTISTKTYLPGSEYPTGAFEITINKPPKGFIDYLTTKWDYELWGRNNDVSRLSRAASSWELIETRQVSNDPQVFIVEYNEENHFVNEFDIRIRVTLADGSVESSKGYYDMNNNSPLVTERVAPPSAKILSFSNNTWRSDLTESNGVYDLILKVGENSTFNNYEVEALSETGQSMATFTVTNNEELVLTGNTRPSVVGVKYQYRIRGVDIFGRYSEWSSENSSSADKYCEGYGAITGSAFIKFFEKFSLKPWEFISQSDFPNNLKTKWNDSEIRKKIASKGTGSLTVDLTSSAIVYIHEDSEYHGGRIGYAARQVSFKGDIHFTYESFGELETIYSEGSYNMSGVDMNGNGGSVSGKINVYGMYPAIVDLNSLKVSGYAFSGDYILTQENGRGAENVTATPNT